MDKELLIEHVLEGYALEAGDGNDVAVLDKWMGRYPEIAEELMEFAAERARLEHLPDPEIPEESSRKFRERGRELFELHMQARNTSPISDLIQAGEKKGLDRTVLAMNLGMSVTFLLKLNRRAIRAASIPQALVEKIAAALGEKAEAVRAFFELPQRAAGSHYKASERPDDIEQEDFARAVEIDLHLSQEQKDSLLKL